jgi:hypothetical protein
MTAAAPHELRCIDASTSPRRDAMKKLFVLAGLVAVILGVRKLMSGNDAEIAEFGDNGYVAQA